MILVQSHAQSAGERSKIMQRATMTAFGLLAYLFVVPYPLNAAAEEAESEHMHGTLQTVRTDGLDRTFTGQP